MLVSVNRVERLVTRRVLLWRGLCGQSGRHAEALSDLLLHHHHHLLLLHNKSLHLLWVHILNGARRSSSSCWSLSGSRLGHEVRSLLYLVSPSSVGERLHLLDFFVLTSHLTLAAVALVNWSNSFIEIGKRVDFVLATSSSLL